MQTHVYLEIRAKATKPIRPNDASFDLSRYRTLIGTKKKIEFEMESDVPKKKWALTEWVSNLLVNDF